MNRQGKKGSNNRLLFPWAVFDGEKVYEVKTIKTEGVDTSSYIFPMRTEAMKRCGVPHHVWKTEGIAIFERSSITICRPE